MAAAVAYLDRVEPALGRAAARFRDMAVSAHYPNAKVPGTEWTIQDVTAHVASVVTRYAEGPEGGGTWAERPADLAGINQRSIEVLGGVAMEELGARIDRDVATLVAQVRSYGDPPPSFRFHGGERCGPTPASGSCSASCSSTAGTSPAPPAGPGRSTRPTPSWSSKGSSRSSPAGSTPNGPAA